MGQVNSGQRVFRVFGGQVPVAAAVAGVVDLDGEAYAEGELSDHELLAHAASELADAATSGTTVLGSFRRTAAPVDVLAQRRERRAAARLLRSQVAEGGAVA